MTMGKKEYLNEGKTHMHTVRHDNITKNLKEGFQMKIMHSENTGMEYKTGGSNLEVRERGNTWRTKMADSLEVRSSVDVACFLRLFDEREKILFQLLEPAPLAAAATSPAAAADDVMRPLEDLLRFFMRLFFLKKIM